MEQINYVETPVVAEATQPKFCIARAIVSLGLSIEGIVVAVLGAIYGLLGVAGGFSMGSDDGAVFAVTFSIVAIMLVVIALISGIIAVCQAKKFYQLYHRESGMAKAGKVIGMITIVISALTIVCCIGGIVLMAMAL